MAKAATHTQFEQVTALYEERQRFEAWLSALEAKRATTPVHIYTRVHADYGARLQRVVEELRTHRTALQELESTLIDRLTALDSEEAKHRDEAAEAELRATVGELASEQFAEVTGRTSGAIATLSEERARLQAELAQLRHLLDVGTAPLPANAVTGEAPRPEPTPPDSPRVRLVDSGAPVSAPAPNAAPAPTPADWELSFENALSARPAAPVSRNSGSRAAEKGPEKSLEGNPFDDLEFLKTMVDRNSGEHGTVSGSRDHAGASSGNNSGNNAGNNAASGAAHAHRVSEPVASPPAEPESLQTMPMSPPVKQRPSQTVPVAASGLPLIMPDAPAPPRTESRFPPPGGSTAGRDSVPSYLKEAPPEQVKTLKCQECGTLNYPTEWYCERCGAELAAL
ncbi:MAG: hypothetical protein ABI889_13585 [Gemmatimonadota bacterium]